MSKHPQNAAGPYWIDQDVCIGCSTCFVEAPDNIRYDNTVNKSYVFRQPETEEELAGVKRAIEYCPVEAVVEEM